MIQPSPLAPATLPPEGALAQLLRKHSDREWLFVSPGGNWGDQLIYEGAYQLARRLGLNWRAIDPGEFDPSRLPEGVALYLQGGGGLNPWGSRRAFKNLKASLSVPEALVVQGPQTCDVSAAEMPALFADAFAGARAGEVHMFARERSSHAYMQRHVPSSAEVHLDHDTALHLCQADMLVLGGLQALPNGRYVLLVSRADDEMPDSALPTTHAAVTLDPAYFATSLSHWVRVHAYSTRIATNRLHSAIGSMLLGRQVTLMPGSYHKNRSIWEYSLSHRGVSWADHAPVEPQSGVNWMRMLPPVVAKSWKVQRFGMWLRGVPVS